jgi:hypothetical protein
MFSIVENMRLMLYDSIRFFGQAVPPALNFFQSDEAEKRLKTPEYARDAENFIE